MTCGLIRAVFGDRNSKNLFFYRRPPTSLARQRALQKLTRCLQDRKNSFRKNRDIPV
jgi:hypothetical protein